MSAQLAASVRRAYRRDMSYTLNVVAVSGSLHAPSKTTALVREILDALALELAIDVHLIELSQVGRDFSGALNRGELSAAAESELQKIEGADLLIVASPVYRASFTGLFKHVFDFVDQYALVDKPVLLAATGGSDRHALILEHQFRPLFSFFQALTLPLGVYAKDSEFTDYRVSDDALRERITLAISRGLPLVRASLPAGLFADSSAVVW
jgi:FMN reductase